MKHIEKLIALALLLALSVCALAACGGNKAEASETILTFAESASIKTIESLNGKKVKLTGYMATLSPLSGEYIYLMNLPYQSCPFCIPNTQQLSNTMAVYAPSGKKFTFTDQPIVVNGRMELGNFTDEYGYEYNYRIVDATYQKVDLSSVSEDYALYQSLASDGVTADVNAMFDYLMFICSWPDYQGSYIDENGERVSYYLYAGDVQNTLNDEGAYGYATQSSADYFPSLIKRVQAVSSTKLKDLTDIIAAAQVLEQKARADLDNGNYTYDEAADKFTLNNAAELDAEFYEIYGQFSEWLNQYQL